MAAGKENPYKVKAYQRAARRIRTFSENIDELVLLYHADDLCASIEEFLLARCSVRRVAVIEGLEFVVEADNFTATVETSARFGGRTPLVSSDRQEAFFAVSTGILVGLREAAADAWVGRAGSLHRLEGSSQETVDGDGTLEGA